MKCHKYDTFLQAFIMTVENYLCFQSALMVGYMIPQKEDEDESEFDSMDQTEHTDGGDENPSPEDVEPENGEHSSDQKPLDEDSQLQNDVEAPQDYDDDE